MNPSTQITTALQGIKALCEKATDGLTIMGHDALWWASTLSSVSGRAKGELQEASGKIEADLAASRETMEKLVKALEHATNVCANVDAIYGTESLKSIAEILTSTSHE